MEGSASKFKLELFEKQNCKEASNKYNLQWKTTLNVSAPQQIKSEIPSKEKL